MYTRKLIKDLPFAYGNRISEEDSLKKIKENNVLGQILENIDSIAIKYLTLNFFLIGTAAISFQPIDNILWRRGEIISSRTWSQSEYYPFSNWFLPVIEPNSFSLSQRL